MSNEGRLLACKGWRARVNPAQHRIVDARTSRYAETYARWQRSPEGNGGALRSSRIAVLGAPNDLGASQRGALMGPAALRTAVPCLMVSASM